VKKYAISLLTIILVCIVIVHYQIPARIHFFMTGFAYYGDDEYERTIGGILPLSHFTIVPNSYDNKPMKVYQYNEDVYLELKSIEFNEFGYSFEFFSHGEGSFEEGILLETGVPFDNQTMKTDKGELLYYLSGEGPGEKKGKSYYIELRPAENTQMNPEDIGNMELNLPVYVWLTTIERK